MYVELHTASAFSFLQGASLPETLVDRAAELGYAALALLDRDGVYGAPRFHKAAKAAGIKPIIGAELTIDGARGAGQTGKAGLALDTPERYGARASARGSGAPRESKKSWLNAEASWLLPVLCESAEGYQNLSKLITRMKMRAEKGAGALTLDELDGHTRGLVALAGRTAL